MLRKANSFVPIFILLFVLACMVSCNQEETYYKFKFIPNNEWSKDQDISFLLDSTSNIVNGNYDVSIELSHNISYQYKNLFLIVDYKHKNSVSLRDTVECVLMDGNGRWYGGGNGATRQLSVLYKTNFRIDTALHNEISIRHAMQDLKLKGIEKVGLKVY